jgi:hypothetical protein
VSNEAAALAACVVERLPRSSEDTMARLRHCI